MQNKSGVGVTADRWWILKFLNSKKKYIKEEKRNIISQPQRNKVEKRQSFVIFGAQLWFGIHRTMKIWLVKMQEGPTAIYWREQWNFQITVSVESLFNILCEECNILYIKFYSTSNTLNMTFWWLQRQFLVARKFLVHVNPIFL